ncbi:MAG: zinc-binding alcohol dehydrogenase [Chloroflexi bacterium]|nr:zinc-binding alcohol dehydrogenase [Chloroflexota bacterium]
MQRQCVWFEKPFHVSVRAEAIPDLAPDQVLVQTIVSAISAGTELLFYRGQVPGDLPVDSSIAALNGAMRYPLQYGYACVGRVVACGAQIQDEWRDRLVFSFQPHASHFIARVDELISIPDRIAPEQAAFLPNLETAVNLLMDGAPIIGEQVIVIGQGIVGLLTTALLAQMPLARVLTFDAFALRREKSRALGATDSFDPNDADAIAQARDADLTYELSGNPDALNHALALTGFEGRIVIGSWYGQKRAPIDFGGAFHRSRIRIISSQVSTIASSFAARWNKVRRLDVARALLARVSFDHLITHRFQIEDAARAYALLDQQPGHTLQVLLTYDP